MAYSKTFVSTNRTVVDLISRQAVRRLEALDLPLDATLLRFQPCELGVSGGEGAQVGRDHATDGSALLRGADTSGAVDVVRNGDGDIPHSGTLTQSYSFTISQYLA